MDVLTRLLAHNHWANARVLSACVSAPADVTAPMIERLNHLARLERMVGAAIKQEAWAWERAETIGDLAHLIDRTGRELEMASCGLDAGDLARTFQLGRFPSPLTCEEGLLHVVSHSGQHRAEVAWDLARAGVDTGNLDFVFWARRT
jgi:uncharacterized damage-inducible protein DinB